MAEKKVAEVKEVKPAEVKAAVKAAVKAEAWKRKQQRQLQKK